MGVRNVSHLLHGVQQANFYNNGLALGSYVASGIDPPSGGAIISGNVGIGATNPGYKLDVQGSSTSYLQQVYNSNATTGGGLYIRSDGTGNLLTLNNNGTDIVTISPAQTTFNNPVSMTSAGDVSMNYDLYFNNPTASYIKYQGPGYIQTESPYLNSDLTLSAANLGSVVIADTALFQNGTNAVNAYKFTNAAGTSVMSVDTTNGRVGIGTTSPTVPLDVTGDARATGDLFVGQLRMDNNSAVRIDNPATNNLAFYTNNSEWVRIDTTGNVGVNTTAPTRKLESLDASNPQMRLTYTAASVYTDLQTTSLGNLYINPVGGGKVGIGVADPGAYKLNVAGSGYFGGTLTATDDLALASATAELKIMESVGATYYGIIDVGDLSADSTYTLSGPSGNILTSTTEPLLTTTGRHTRVLDFKPEFAGATFTKFYGAGTDTVYVGAMSTDTESASPFHNFYQWTSAETAALNSYTVAFSLALPSDFDSWATSNAIQAYYKTTTAVDTDQEMEVYIYDSAGSAVASSTSGNASTSWTTVNFAGSSLSGWATGGNTAFVYIRLRAKSSNVVKLGEIKLNYLSKW